MANTTVQFKNKETKENIYPKTTIDSIDGFTYNSSTSAYVSSNNILLNEKSKFLISNSSLIDQKNILFEYWKNAVEQKLLIFTEKLNNL
jgi:hypothetical protein